jgi:GDP-4-dehydro-6-deoxy-D-mannose reductase
MGRRSGSLPCVRVLVTGASGFVGGHLVPRLEAEGCRVAASDREMDVADPAAVAARIAEVRPEAIVHLAAQSSVAVSWKQPELTYRVNYLGTRAVLKVAERVAPQARMLMVSTADLYGSAAPGAEPFGEEAALRPRSPYARSKAAADLLGGAFAARGLDVVRVRPFNHTGPGQTDVFVLSSFARQVAAIEAGASEPVLRVGNLDSVRDFLDIEDVIDAYVALLDRAVPAGVYNVASGTGVRVGDAPRGLCELAGVEPRVEVNPDFFRPTDIAVGCAGRLRETTGWEPRVPFRRSLERLLDDWRARISAA